MLASVRRRQAGFTLLELLSVLGVMAVLAGFGLGFLQRGSTDLDLALGIVRDQLRVAANTATARALPAEVEVLPGEIVGLRARVSRAVGFWHFEPEERWFDRRLRPQLIGTPEPAGRFGHAFRPDPETGDAMLTVPAGAHDLFDLTDGFALRLDLRLDERTPMGVARLGRGFELALDGALRPVAKVTLEGGQGKPGAVVELRADRPLRAGAWTTLELAFDGAQLRLRIDGREAARAAAAGEVFRGAGDALEVSFGRTPILGLVDEVQLFAYERTELLRLPVDVTLEEHPPLVRFGSRGELLAPARFTLRWQDEVSSWDVAPGGVLRPAAEKPADG